MEAWQEAFSLRSFCLCFGHHVETLTREAFSWKPFESERGRVRSSPARSKEVIDACPTHDDDTGFGAFRTIVLQECLTAWQRLGRSGRGKQASETPKL
jgi:hypothetical protein